MNGIKGILFDLDGVLYVGEALIPGAAETISALKNRKLPLRFVTNTTTQSHKQLHEKLVRLGLPVEPAEILSAPQAALLALRRMGKPRCFFVVSDNIRGDFSEFPEDNALPDVVVVGDIGDGWNYTLLNQVFKLVRRGAHMVALHKNKFWQTPAGLQLDIGAFVAGIEHATGKQATVTGKPSPAFFDIAIRELGLTPHETAIIGDDIDSDIGGGQAVGLTGILVKTGKYREKYANESQIRPDVVLDSVADLPQALGLN